MNGTTLVMADDIRSTFSDSVGQFADWLTANAGITNALKIIGGMIGIITIVVLLAQKYKPGSQLAQINVQAGGLIAACCIAVVCVAPKMALTLLATVVGWFLEFVYNVINNIFS